METVEMDLMQAQIGSLATDVSRLEAKVGKSTSDFVITVDMSMEGSSPVISNPDKSWSEINEAFKSGKKLYFRTTVVDSGNNMTFTIPVFSTINSDSGNLTSMAGGAVITYLLFNMVIVIQAYISGDVENYSAITYQLSNG